MTLLVVILGVFLVAGAGMAGLILWTTQRSLQKASDKLNLSMSENLTQISLRNGAELRLAIEERLGQGFIQTQTNLSDALHVNRRELSTGLLQTTQALEAKFKTLENQVAGRLDVIGKNVEDKLNQNLKEGFAHFAKVTEHLQAAEQKLASLGTVGQSISELNQLLKLPHLRGGFGEASLERLLSDFIPRGSYELQYAIDPHSTERVDAIVRLAKQVLPIDSKFPREQVLHLFQTQDPATLEAARKTLSDVIKTQARSIAKKYIRPEHGTTDMALLFLPSETLYFEVIRDVELFESLSKLKVYPASPNTLSISLHAISVAQEYYQMAQGVEKTIEEVSKARKHFEHFEQRFEDVGKGLKKAQDAFETAQSHLGRYENSVIRLTGPAGSTIASNEPAPSFSKNDLGETQGSLI